MRVHVIGNLCRDTGLAVPHFPRPGETLVATQRSAGLGGKGLNQAVAASRACAEVILHAAVGPGEAVGLATALADEPRLTLRLVEGEAPTDVSLLLVQPDGENAIVSLCAAALDFNPVGRGALDEVARGDILLLQGNLSLATTLACLAEGQRRGARTVVNPSPLWENAPRAWPDVDLLVTNAGEATDLAGETDAREAAGILCAAGAGAVAVTRGAQGVVFCSDNGTLSVAAPRVEVLDTTGAGDVFCGTFVGGLARGLSPRAALEGATGAASLAVTRAGALASCPTAGEIAALFPPTNPRSSR